MSAPQEGYAPQPTYRYRNRRHRGPGRRRRTTIAFAIFLGYIGLHRFTLGQWGLGLAYIALFVVSMSMDLYIGSPWFSLAAGVAYYDAYRFYNMSDEEFAERYLEVDGTVEGPRPVIGQYLVGHPTGGGAVVSRRQRADLLRTAQEQYEAYNFQEAAKCYEQALNLDLADGYSRVLAARCYSLVEDKQAAYRHLRRAFQLRASNLDLLEHDAGFAWLRQQDDFAQQLMRKFDTGNSPAATSSASALTEGRTSNILDQLERLGDLRDRGLLTAEEFQREKERLLR